MTRIYKRSAANNILSRNRVRSKAIRLIGPVLHNPVSNFERYMNATNKKYVIIGNNQHFRGFAAVKTFPTHLQIELIASNTRPAKRPPAGQAGWGTQLMNAIKNNAKKLGLQSVVVHDPVGSARGFYTKKGYNTASNTSGGTRTMKRKLSPNVSSKRRLSPIRENSPKRARLSPRQSPRSPRSASARGSPSK
jgi:N-acetylglutamate synthase-like GNAT family acetyltransferase